MTATPRSLIERLRHGSHEDSWRIFHNLYAPLIFKWLSRLGLTTSDAEDATQEVLLVVVEELPRFEHNHRLGAFRRWLRTIVVNRARRVWRLRSKGAHATTIDTLSLAATIDPNSDPDEHWEREHNVHVTHYLLQILEPEFRLSTWLAFRRQVVDGQKAATVATELGMSVDSVLAAKSRVLRRMRKEAKGLLDEV